MNADYVFEVANVRASPAPWATENL